MRFFKRLGWLLTLVLLVMAVGCFVPRPFFASGQSDEKSVEILVISNPIHTDIALPATPEMREVFSFLAQGGMPLDNPNVRWLMFGWGGRGFYLETPTWSELKLAPVLKALTVDQSVLHVEPLGTIKNPNPTISRYKISQAALDVMVNEILKSFARDSSGNTELIAGRSYGEYDRFYEANGSFNALFGCNTWAAKMLRYAGLQTGWWNPIPQSLRLSLNLQN